MLKNGAASVISSSDTVGEEGAFIRGGRLLTIFTFQGAFIQSITVLIYKTGSDFCDQVNLRLRSI